MDSLAVRGHGKRAVLYASSRSNHVPSGNVYRYQHYQILFSWTEEMSKDSCATLRHRSPIKRTGRLLETPGRSSRESPESTAGRVGTNQINAIMANRAHTSGRRNGTLSSFPLSFAPHAVNASNSSTGTLPSAMATLHLRYVGAT